MSLPLLRKKSKKIQETLGDRILNVITIILLILVIMIVVYPIAFIIAASFSNPKALQAGKVFMWPVDFTLTAYEFVFNYGPVWTGFRNTLFYCAWGVMLDMTINMLVAYPLSRPHFAGRQFYVMGFFLAGRVGAGLIPQFLLRVDLGMYNTIWAILISGGVSYGNILILRTSIRSSIPGELFDAAMIDGAGHFQCMMQLAFPLAKATLSVLVLYSLVGHWNEYFNAMIYVTDERLFPLQLVLRPVMTATGSGAGIDPNKVTSSQLTKNDGYEHVQYALIVVSTAPIIIAYSFVEKYFEKGMMIGSVKG